MWSQVTKREVSGNIKLNPQHVFAQFAIRISSKSRTARRRSLKAVPPAAADYDLESRLMLSASSDDEIPDGGDTGTGGDTNTGGGGGDTLTGGGGDTGTGGGDTLTGGGASNPLLFTMTLFMVDDAVDVGYEVGILTMTGGDGSSITFSMDDASGMFAIDPNTGVITVANQDDWNSGEGFAVTFHATQSGATVDAGGTIALAISGWEITKVSKTNGDTPITASDDIKVEVKKPADRTQTFDVRIRLQKKVGNDWQPVANGEKVFTAQQSKFKVKLVATFMKQPAGEYRILWQADDNPSGGWREHDHKDFTITP